jgi:ferrous iron transport protein A
MALQQFDIKQFLVDTELKMQPSFKKKAGHPRHEAARNLTELKRGEHGVLERIDLPEEDARRLMELGFLPGHTIVPAHAAPGGDPRVFRVDGSEVALRRETARKLILRPVPARADSSPGPGRADSTRGPSRAGSARG